MLVLPSPSKASCLPTFSTSDSLASSRRQRRRRPPPPSPFRFAAARCCRLPRHPMALTGRLLAVAALSFLCECLPPRDPPLPQLMILSLSCSYFPFFPPKCEFQQLCGALDSCFFSLPDDPPLPALCFVGFDSSVRRREAATAAAS